MSDATLGGHRVLSAHVHMPGRGAWWADAVIDAEETLTGAVSLVLDGLTLTGRIIAGGPQDGAARYRLSGGAGWGTVGTARSYSTDSGVRLATVLQDAAREAGETIDAATIPATTLGPHWARPAGPLALVLQQVAPEGWHVGEDGVTRLGGRASVPLTRAVTVTARDEAAGRWEIAADDLADIVPGVVFEGRAAVDVEHHVSAGKTRSVLWSEGRVPEASRQLGALKALVQLLTPELRYRGVWEYRIVSQSGERLDLQPTRSTLGLPDLQRVRVRPGVPGCSAEHKLGATCLVSFVNCDPARPVVVGFEDADGAGFEADMLAFQGGTRAVARVGDPVQMFFPASMAVTGTVSGNPFAGTITVVTPGHGIIQAGAPKVRA